MKQLKLGNKSYQYLERNFREWLQLLGYTSSTYKSYPIHVREFLHYLESRKVEHIEAVKSEDVECFMQHVSTRKNEMYKSGGLSARMINKIQLSLHTFSKYLKHHKIDNVNIAYKQLEAVVLSKEILSIEEIKLLYEATYYKSKNNTEAMGGRSRAILGILYGCGLRINECRYLDMDDVDVKNKTLEVLRGKGGKTRMLPIIGRAVDDLELYKEEYRYWFLESHKQKPRFNTSKTVSKSEAFVLSQTGNRLLSGYYLILKQLAKKANLNKSVSPHLLRHSIATHLLANGVDIESIREFLGHSSLESTQIYTHILNHYERPEKLMNG